MSGRRGLGAHGLDVEVAMGTLERMLECMLRNLAQKQPHNVGVLLSEKNQIDKMCGLNITI